ncbi:MAG: amino acid synthesis family protein [Candidatus Dormibacteraeota bacterium]|uniref:Amino acid synthesis family protein n=1 Tax=Candidatus Aeolococcus gillhamiae TaxID=3127015 RepID=A0A934K1B8_9BACT|nr:amino acid synthesis family protein [Candidatus Dormibacteraeota bacterium]
MPLRKVVTIVEDIYREGGKQVDPPTRIAAALAVIHNPLAGQDWQRDLTTLIDQFSDPLGRLLGSTVASLLGGPAEAFGKGALVGLDGEIEHGSAIIHTLTFGDPIREAAGHATSLLPAAEKRGAAGSTLDIALKHIHDVTTRSHHQTFEVRIPDAPRADEMVIVAVMSISGRPHARLSPFGADPQTAG